MTEIPRESVKLVGPITSSVTEDGVTTVADPSTFSVAVAPHGARPTTWSTPRLVNGKAYVLVGPGHLVLDPGQWDVWVRYTATPEVPVVNAGSFYIT